MDKKTLRKEIRARAELLSDEYKNSASNEIQRLLINSSDFRAANKIFIYIATKKEPDTSHIISEALKCGKEVYVPKCIDKGIMVPVKINTDSVFIDGYNGIKEPVCFDENIIFEKFDLAVIPCVTASMDGKRLGHGGGFYDIFLSKCETLKICLCFEEILSDNIPIDDNDIYMDRLITEKEVFYCE